MSKIWFKNKDYGYGWVPVTKEGWAVILIFIIILFIAISLILYFVEYEPLAVFLHISFTSIWTLCLVYIAYKKGEKPEWRWGGKKIQIGRRTNK